MASQLEPHDFVYEPQAEVVARALLLTRAYLFRPDDFYTWKSGVKAPVYTDCRVIQAHPGSSKTIVRALARSLENAFPSCVAIVGMAEAGIVWSSRVAHDLGLAHAFVRKTAKAHGRAGMVAGALSDGDSVVLVDDLMAGGGTAITAIEQIESETGAHVIGVQTIVNWNFTEMRQRFSEINVPYKTLVSYPQILEAAVANGTLTTVAATELAAFYTDPRGHQWNLDAFRTLDDVAELSSDDPDGRVEFGG